MSGIWNALSDIGIAAAIAAGLIGLASQVSDCNQSSHRKDEVIEQAKGYQCTKIVIDGYEGVQCRWDDNTKNGATVYVVYRRNVDLNAEATK